jgi:hypothetical protein
MHRPRAARASPVRDRLEQRRSDAQALALGQRVQVVDAGAALRVRGEGADEADRLAARLRDQQAPAAASNSGRLRCQCARLAAGIVMSRVWSETWPR